MVEAPKSQTATGPPIKIDICDFIRCSKQKIRVKDCLQHKYLNICLFIRNIVDAMLYKTRVNINIKVLEELRIKYLQKRTTKQRVSNVPI